ncbi:hypothetical protein LZ30DRAFT_192393 [Colletotrichum cereale]|nr:hypothetical protein LZ30DRAFT_192393 [Colletotrichum cereale]
MVCPALPLSLSLSLHLSSCVKGSEAGNPGQQPTPPFTVAYDDGGMGAIWLSTVRRYVPCPKASQRERGKAKPLSSLGRVGVGRRADRGQLSDMHDTLTKGTGTDTNPYSADKRHCAVAVVVAVATDGLWQYKCPPPLRGRTRIESTAMENRAAPQTLPTLRAITHLGFKAPDSVGGAGWPMAMVSLEAVSKWLRRVAAPWPSAHCALSPQRYLRVHSTLRPPRTSG